MIATDDCDPWEELTRAIVHELELAAHFANKDPNRAAHELVTRFVQAHDIEVVAPDWDTENCAACDERLCRYHWGFEAGTTHLSRMIGALTECGDLYNRAADLVAKDAGVHAEVVRR